jgi:hypothetical protein
MARVLTGCGVEIDQPLPWIAAWFERYQLADGGYNCDETAYLVAEECPSSMVGTIAPLEAMTQRPHSATCDRAAALVLGRALVHGSPTRHNAAERDAASRWGELCFPRFYFYDVLRGLAAVVAWALAHRRPLPLVAVAPTVAALAARFPDGVVGVERVAFADKSTWTFEAPEGWVRRAATRWPLLDLVSQPGAPSPALTRQWRTTRRGLLALLEGEQLIV